MKLFSNMSIGIIILFSTACGGGNHIEEGSKYTGTIEAIGMTTYQYGTHTLNNDQDFYALKSDVIELSQYEGKKVNITATKIEGYPVDGGPIYLNVLQISE
jgi:hypothetical protein